MSHKTFISYKYSDAFDVRDKIICALGTNAKYYRGENGFSNDLSDRSAKTIKDHLKKMIFSTTVTIFVASPEMLQSEWIPWEIEYSLRKVERDGITSCANGIVGVIKKINGGYGWIMDNTYPDKPDKSKLPKIVRANMDNLANQHFSDENIDSYISLVEEDEFLVNADYYISCAYRKSKISNFYDLVKMV